MALKDNWKLVQLTEITYPGEDENPEFIKIVEEEAKKRGINFEVIEDYYKIQPTKKEPAHDNATL